MKKVLILMVFAFSSACMANAQDVTGDWQGMLNAGMAQLHMVVHITKDNDGNLKATMDSLDQGRFGIPVTSISLKNSKLKFTVDSIQGSYEGKLNADATKVYGTWAQRGATLDLDLKRAKPKPAPPSDIDGAWLGTLDTGAMKLQVVFHILNTADGLTATMDSPNQGAKGIPVTAVTRKGSSLKIEMKQAGGAFEGKISPDLATIDGTWTQGGGTLPLVLKRVEDAAELEPRRPQNPVTRFTSTDFVAPPRNCIGRLSYVSRCREQISKLTKAAGRRLITQIWEHLHVGGLKNGEGLNAPQSGQYHHSRVAPLQTRRFWIRACKPTRASARSRIPFQIA